MNKNKMIITCIGLACILCALAIGVRMFYSREESVERNAKSASPGAASQFSVADVRESAEAAVLSDSAENAVSEIAAESAEISSTASGGVAQSTVEAEQAEAATAEQKAEQYLQSMDLTQKILQMFFITPEALTGSDSVTVAGSRTDAAIAENPVGGLIYFENNLVSPEQTSALLSNTKAMYQNKGLPLPFLGVDEEGGTVTRIAKNAAFGVSDVGDMRDIGSAGDVSRASSAGAYIGSYLSGLGFNLDFAPVADVLSNPENTVVRRRSFGSDPNLVRSMSQAEAEALTQNGIVPVLKHFPGHGATAADSHNGYAETSRSLEEMLDDELVPFTDVNVYAPVIMAGHISAPNVTGDGTPASLSGTMIEDILRTRLAFQGIVITDALNMGAIANEYSSGEAAVKAVRAGIDMLLMPYHFASARDALIVAVQSGEIPEERIDASVRRILTVKARYGLI